MLFSGVVSFQFQTVVTVLLSEKQTLCPATFDHFIHIVYLHTISYGTPQGYVLALVLLTRTRLTLACDQYWHICWQI